MIVKISIKVTIQVASRDVCKQYNKTFGVLEIISEGYRCAWAETRDEAIKSARGLIGSDLTTIVEVVGE